MVGISKNDVRRGIDTEGQRIEKSNKSLTSSEQMDSSGGGAGFSLAPNQRRRFVSWGWKNGNGENDSIILKARFVKRVGRCVDPLKHKLLQRARPSTKKKVASLRLYRCMAGNVQQR